MSERSYTVGSTFPPLTPGVLRVYSMRFCPYSQRVRLILIAKDVKFETVNINCKRRPEWYSDVNSSGLVPCIQHDDGRVIQESFIISEYLDAIYPDKKLIPSDPYEKAKNQMLIDNFQRVAGLLYKSLKFKDKEAFNEIHKVLANYEKVLTESYFGGKQPGITDYMIWPWFERFESLKSLINDSIDEKRLPKISKWIKRMLKLKPIIETKSDETQMVEFYKVSLTNQEPPYDIGLEPPPESTEENAEADQSEKPAENAN